MSARWYRPWLLSVVIVAQASLALAWGKNPWPALKNPSDGEPQAIGEYSAGCLAGAQALSLDGAGYQVMHPSRLRYYGHPDLLAFIRTLGAGMQAQGMVLLLGDLSHDPRG